MEDVMDLYNRLPPTDIFSLEEMIEHDMQSDHFESDGYGENLMPHHHRPAQHLECGGDMEGDTVMTSPGARFENNDVLLDGTRLESDLFCYRDNDTPWFNMSNGNLDYDPSTLLVNPITGLPTAPFSIADDDRSDSGEDSLVSRCRTPALVMVNPSLVECDDAVNSVTVQRRQFESNRHRLIITNGDNYFEKLNEGDSSESITSDDDDDVEDKEELNCDIVQHRSISMNEGSAKMMKPLTNRTTKKSSNGPINGRLPLRFPSEHAQLGRGPYAARSYLKPAYSYSCLIAIALKNSETGSLPVSEIYSFLIKTFPYFKTAPKGWKNSVRHNLSLNKCFEKIENGASKRGGGGGGSNQGKGCRWALNPNKAVKMDEEVQKWNRKDPAAIKKSMARPETFKLLEQGALKAVDPTTERMLLKGSKRTTVKEEPIFEREDDVGSDTEEDSSDSERSVHSVAPHIEVN